MNCTLMSAPSGLKIGARSVVQSPLGRYHIPFYVAAPTSTVDLTKKDGSKIPIEERDPKEVSDRFPVYNPAFDVTPAKYITAIITEVGVLKPSGIKSCK